MCDFVTVKAEKYVSGVEGRDHSSNLPDRKDEKAIPLQSTAHVEGDDETSKISHI